MNARPSEPALSVLIPALNEALALPALLNDLAAQRGIRCELIVADGGSSDDTAAIACRHRARVVRAPRGRGAQLNAAVAVARAPWLLCLHADSRLTAPDQLAQALQRLKAEARSDAAVAGHWPLRFSRTTASHDILFRHLEAKTASNRAGTVNGDQGLLLHQEFLAALGGFDASLPFYEDQRLAGKIFAEGRFVLLPGLLETAARRFEAEGHGARLLLMALIVGADAAGLDAWLHSLPSLYREQQATSQLSAAPLVASLLAHIAALPVAQRRLVWQRAGHLVAGNAWQLAQALDARRNGPPKWLQRFDAKLAWWFAKPGAERLIAAALPSVLRALASRV